ncbi:MAG TPA: head decoration protein [Caulobacteraceae bacterium]|jgi:hypothetical protein|nr:head decoration protein [Caulobacteraceae bacterium]
MGNPQVTPIIEHRHAWGFMVWDPTNGIATRSQITLAEGFGVLTAGLVLAKLEATAVYAALGANTGNFTCSAVVMNGAVQPGGYSIEMTDPTHFVVLAPLAEIGAQPEEVGHGVLGAAFNAGGLQFTLTAGGTAAVAGDSATITVAPAATPLYIPFDPTGANGAGSETAVAILGSGYKDTTTSNQSAAALTAGPARINSGELVWGANVTTLNQQAAALAQLAALGIRSSPS